MKTCTCCKVVKPLSEFNKDSRSSDGHLIYCKPCLKLRQRPYLIKSRSKRLASSKTYYLKNKEKRKAYNHEYNRRPETLAANRERMARKDKIDIQYKIRSRCRARIKNACRKQFATKAAKTENLLGCSVSQFRHWIEMNFEPGMAWENFGNKEGQWSYDHYIPCDSFDLTDEQQQKTCFGWFNVFPMWHKENLSKKNTMPPPLSLERQARKSLFEQMLQNTPDSSVTIKVNI